MKKIPHCARVECMNYETPPANNDWYRKHKTYYTKAFGTVQRYQCKRCGKTFSAQTFSINYYAKKKIDYRKLFDHIISKSGIRDMGRAFNATTDTISNRIARLARQAIYLDQTMKKHINLNEDLVADGFESFAVSQYFPDNINILIGKESQFIYFLDYITIRRKGRMTEAQKERREELETIFKADPQGVKKSFTRLLDSLCCLVESPRTLYTDKKRDYKAAIKNHELVPELIKKKKLAHVTISSRKARTLSNNLFAVNYIDRQIRKSLANHVRETIQFTRNVNNGLNRLVLFAAHHNYWKDFRITNKRVVQNYHGEIAGLSRKEIDKKKRYFFTRRPFANKFELRGVASDIWYRKFATPLNSNIEYVQAHLYM